MNTTPISKNKKSTLTKLNKASSDPAPVKNISRTLQGARLSGSLRGKKKSHQSNISTKNIASDKSDFIEIFNHLSKAIFEIKTQLNSYSSTIEDMHDRQNFQGKWQTDFSKQMISLQRLLIEHLFLQDSTDSQLNRMLEINNHYISDYYDSVFSQIEEYYDNCLSRVNNRKFSQAQEKVVSQAIQQPLNNKSSKNKPSSHSFKMPSEDNPTNQDTPCAAPSLSGIIFCRPRKNLVH